MKKIVFTGGGTLGHVMPNVYLIEELKSDYECYYIGSSGIEKEKVKEVVKEYYEIQAVKLIRGKVWKNIKIPFVLISSIFQAKKVLREINPDLVFSKGGYVSLPVCIAAKMLKIPVITHESDYSFGLANKMILKICDVMCVNFDHLVGYNKKVVYTGPILNKAYDIDSKDYKNLNIDKNKPTLLIVGGSLGSKKINDNIYSILKELLTTFNVIHITGKGNKTIESYGNYNAFEMFSDMANLYNISDFILGRSGAGVTAECFYKGKPMLLVPLQNKSTRGDQVLNAEYYVKHGVAKIIEESKLNSQILLKEINVFYSNLDFYLKSYKKTNKINGKKKVIEIIKNTIK